MFLRRFYDQKGNRLPIGRIGNAFVALLWASARVGLGYRPQRPTISQCAARRIREVIPADGKIAEFGSGLSTLWFAKHFATVASVEHEAGWARLISQKLQGLPASKVDYITVDAENYTTALDTYPDRYFDLILIDGLARDACLRTALAKVKPGGYIYVDNTDADLDDPNGEMRRAEAILTAAVAETNGSIEYFTDFAPINFFAEQGALARIGLKP